MRRFNELDEREILALAIALEEEHGRIYADYAAGLTESFPASAKVFSEMAEEENEHRRWLIDLYQQKFGEHIPLLRRQDVEGFVRHEPIWMVRPLGLDKVRTQARRDRARDAQFLSLGTGTHNRRGDPQTPGRSRGGGGQARQPCSSARRDGIDSRRHGKRSAYRTARVRVAVCATGPHRADRRLGLDTGTDFRRRLRDA